MRVCEQAPAWLRRGRAGPGTKSCSELRPHSAGVLTARGCPPHARYSQNTSRRPFPLAGGLRRAFCSGETLKKCRWTTVESLWW